MAAYCPQISKMEFLNIVTKSVKKVFLEQNNNVMSNSEDIGSDKIEDQHVFKVASDENTAAENTKQFGCQKMEMEFPKPLVGDENAAAVEKIITETEMCVPESQLNCSKESSSEKQLKLQKWDNKGRKKLSSKQKQKIRARNAKKFKEENLNNQTNSQLVNKSALYRCNLCSSEYSSRANLNRHKRNAHESHPSIKCNLCPSEFLQQKYLNRHIKIAHGSRQAFKCNLCGKFSNSAELASHIKEHRETDCHKTFDGKEKKITFSSQLLKNTSDIGCEVAIPVTMENFHAKGNGGTRKLMQNENQHKKLGNKKRNSSSTKPKLRPQRRSYIEKGNTIDYDNKNTRAQCSFCQKSFVDKYSLKFHFQHVHVNPLSIKCNICQKTFSLKGNLRRHIAVMHANVKDHSDFVEEQINETDFKDSAPDINNVISKTAECDSEKDKSMYKCDMNDETVPLIQFCKTRKLFTSENIPNEMRTALEKALKMTYRGNLGEDLSKYKCKLCSITCLDSNALDNHMKRH